MEPIKAEFQFTGIQIVYKHLNEMPNRNFLFSKFNFNVRIEVRVKADSKAIIPIVEVTLRETNDPMVLATFRIACVFEVVNFKESIIMGKDGLYIVPMDMDMTIRPIAISTVRGIIYSELRGTYLQNAIMPVLYMNTFVTEPPQQTTQPAKKSKVKS